MRAVPEISAGVQPVPTPKNILTTTRLKLVPFDQAHIPFLHSLWTDPRVRRFLWDDRVISHDEAADVVGASLSSFCTRGFGFWVIHEIASSNKIGFAGLRDFGDSAEVEILYGLSPPWWGDGIAIEAAQVVLGFAFDVCHLPRVYAGSDPANAASIHVIERLGMRLDGRRVVNGVECLYYVLEEASR